MCYRGLQRHWIHQSLPKYEWMKKNNDQVHHMPVCYHNEHTTTSKEDITKAVKEITPGYVQHSPQGNL